MEKKMRRKSKHQKEISIGYLIAMQGGGKYRD